ncbi:MAG: hypothetical protein QF473_10450 [Planctomycetota bacterium]|jgi:hypothetical protein|nr:hypothetical protein [Planctomycetota bacterium]
MIQNPNELRITLEQLQRMMQALEDLKNSVLPKDPNLFAAMAEGPLKHIERLRVEIDGYIHELTPAG